MLMSAPGLRVSQAKAGSLSGLGWGGGLAFPSGVGQGEHSQC